MCSKEKTLNDLVTYTGVIPIKTIKMSTSGHQLQLLHHSSKLANLQLPNYQMSNHRLPYRTFHQYLQSQQLNFQFRSLSLFCC
jgi:hypothetical protein